MVGGGSAMRGRVRPPVACAAVAILMFALSPIVGASGRQAVSAPADALAGASQDDTWRSRRVNVSSKGRQARRASEEFFYYGTGPDISADGRFVVFASDAINLIPRDTNGVPDVFIRDRLRDTTRRISVGARGRQSNGASTQPVISADGRTVAFVSRSSNLTRTDRDTRPDVFVRNRATGTTRLVSADLPGRYRAAGPSISNHGRFVAFVATHGSRQVGSVSSVFRRDRAQHRTRRVSHPLSGPDQSSWPTLSAHGRFVAFTSHVRLVPKDRNQAADVYVRDMRRRAPEMSPLRGGTNQDISAGGRFVAMVKYGGSAPGVVTSNAYLWDRVRDTRRRLSLHANGGRVPNVIPPDPARPITISADGRTVAFVSQRNLVRSDRNDEFNWDVYVRDRVTGALSVVPTTPTGRPANSDSDAPALSAHGRHVAYLSFASNLVARDTNDWVDVFVARRR